MHSAKSLFGSDSAQFIDIIDQLALALAKKKAKYSFMVVDDYERILREDSDHGMQVYWSEIIARAHLTAVVAILRSRHWINAVVAATNDNNLLAFAAAFRGLIESSADTQNSLGGIAISLAENHVNISRALSGKIGNQCFVSKDIEDALIHFKYARHLTKTEMATAPETHKALQVRQYIEGLEKGQVHKVTACYKSLCDLTHPGASSVWMWIASENGVDLELNPNQDESEITYYLTEYRDTFSELFMFAFNSAVLVLNVLNYFPLKKFHTPTLLDWNLSGIPLWQKCQSKLGERLPLAREDKGLILVKSNPAVHTDAAR